MEETAQQKVLQFKKRGKGKYTADYKSDDIYDFYCKKYGNKYNLSKSDFLLVLRDLNDVKFDLMINDAWTFRIPCRLGDFRVRKRKVLLRLDEDGELDTTKLKPDWKSTKELWSTDAKARKEKKLIFHFNEHTDGYKFPWFWDKVISNAINQSAYKIIITRTHNRQKADALLSDKTLDYFE